MRRPEKRQHDYEFISMTRHEQQLSAMLLEMTLPLAFVMVSVASIAFMFSLNTLLG